MARAYWNTERRLYLFCSGYDADNFDPATREAWLQNILVCGPWVDRQGHQLPGNQRDLVLIDSEDAILEFRNAYRCARHANRPQVLLRNPYRKYMQVFDTKWKGNYAQFTDDQGRVRMGMFWERKRPAPPTMRQAFG